MSTLIRAPYPGNHVTIVLPSPELLDTQASQAGVIVKRSMLGRIITYVKSNDKQTLRLPFQVTRMKALEIEEFFRVFFRAPLQLELYDGTKYKATLASPIERTATGRYLGNVEMVAMTLIFSAEKL